MNEFESPKVSKLVKTSLDNLADPHLQSIRMRDSSVQADSISMTVKGTITLEACSRLNKTVLIDRLFIEAREVSLL